MKKQIFLLHFAGGNCFSYKFLTENLATSYEINALELPGRGKRLHQSLLGTKKEAVNDYLQQIENRLNGRPFLVYGHSMGASLGLRVVKRLEEKALKPEILVVSGNSGPGLKEEKYRYLMEKEAFIVELKEMGGMPEHFFEHDDLVDFCIPIIKSDFKICEEKTPLPAKIDTPIFALMGHLEESVDRINNWKNFTNAGFQSKILKGNHFFIYEHKELIRNLMNKFLS